MSSPPGRPFDPNSLPAILPPCCVKVLGRPGWFDPALLATVRLKPANLLIRAISSPRVAGTEIACTTIGDTIFFRDFAYFEPHSPAGLALLAHEIRHVEQYRKHGGVFRFSLDYVREYLRGGYGTNITFEEEAYQLGGVVQAHLETEFAHNAAQAVCEITPAGHSPNALFVYLTPYPDLPRRS